MIARSTVALFATGLLMVTLTGCNRETDGILKALTGMSREAVTEVDARIDKAHDLLASDVAKVPQISRLLGVQTDAADISLSWDNSPYIAVGVVGSEEGSEGKVLALYPRASDGIAQLLVAAGKGPEVGDLTIIPNTFSFTLPMHYAPPGAPARLTALIDVDKVLLNGVLKPVAAAAKGYAFLANRDRMVILSTHPTLLGQPLSKWSIPVPESGGEATGKTALAGIDYYVASAASKSANGWIVGVAVPVSKPGG